MISEKFLDMIFSLKPLSVESQEQFKSFIPVEIKLKENIEESNLEDVEIEEPIEETIIDRRTPVERSTSTNLSPLPNISISVRTPFVGNENIRIKSDTNLKMVKVTIHSRVGRIEYRLGSEFGNLGKNVNFQLSSRIKRGDVLVISAVDIENGFSDNMVVVPVEIPLPSDPDVNMPSEMTYNFEYNNIDNIKTFKVTRTNQEEKPGFVPVIIDLHENYTTKVIAKFDEDIATHHYNYVNIHRRKNGLTELVRDARLDEIARMRSAENTFFFEMAGEISHGRPNGYNGLDFSYAESENIETFADVHVAAEKFYGSPDAQDKVTQENLESLTSEDIGKYGVDQFINSPGHNANMLRDMEGSNVTRKIGVGVAITDFEGVLRYHITQIFGYDFDGVDEEYIYKNEDIPTSRSNDITEEKPEENLPSGIVQLVQEESNDTFEEIEPEIVPDLELTEIESTEETQSNEDTELVELEENLEEVEPISEEEDL